MNNVFLGGTCNGTNWRDKLIKKLKINYFNPVVDDWNEESQLIEEIEKEHAFAQLYCITPQMLGVFSIAEATQASMRMRERCVVCLLKEWDGKSFDKSQWKSLLAFGRLIATNGGLVFFDLDKTAEALNNLV